MSNLIDTKTGDEITHINCNDYLEHLWNTEEFHMLISDHYWNGGVDTDAMFKYMIESAKRDRVILIDSDIWDYDKAMFACYGNSDDKGLS